jgi:hypothetical protein
MSTHESEAQSSAQSPSASPSNASSSSSASAMKGALRGHDYATQVQMLAPGGGQKASDVQAAAAEGVSGSGGSLPHADRIQRSFGGYDISNVQAHTDAAAANASASMGATAYASGNHVALGAGGQDLHTVAHEAAHVVQQRAGVQLSGGVGKAGDAYEQHADKVADAVVAGKSAEPLLAEMAGGGTGGAVQSKAVQRQTPTPPTTVNTTNTGANETNQNTTNTTNTPPENTEATGPTPEELAQQSFEATRTAAKATTSSATTPEGIRDCLAALPAQASPVSPTSPTPTFAINQNLAGSMVGKLLTAFQESRAAWARADEATVALGGSPTAALNEANFITNRLAMVAAVAPGAIDRAIDRGSVEKPVNVEDAFWNIVSSNWDICAPEEEATPELLTRIGGVYKAFDAGDIWGKMAPGLQVVWEEAGGQARWMDLVKDQQPIPVAPPGFEADPRVTDYVAGSVPAYPGTVSGFISTAEALKSPDIIAGDKAKVLDLLALQANRYPSPKMLLGSMGAAGAGAMRGATASAPKPARLGKPSMFYLLAFKENVYVADNREHGVTAGNEPELQTTNMPAQAFLMGNLMVKA